MEIKIKDLEKKLKALVSDTKDGFSMGLAKLVREDKTLMSDIEELIKKHKYGFTTSFFDDYTSKYIYKCNTCGVEDFHAASVAPRVCPNCHSNHLLFSSSGSRCTTLHHNLFMVYETNDDYAIFFLIELGVSANIPDVNPKDPFAALENAKLNIVVNYVKPLVFSYKFGLRKLSSTGQSLTLAEKVPNVEILKNASFIAFKDKLKEHVFFKDENFLEALNSYCEDVVSSSKKRSSVRFKREELIKELEALKFDMPTKLLEENLKTLDDVIIVRKSRKEFESDYTVVCPNCSHIGEATFPHSLEYSDEKYVCPHCGKEFTLRPGYSYKPYSPSFTVGKTMISQYWQRVDDNMLVCRNFASGINFSLPAEKVSFVHVETARTFVQDKKTLYFASDGKSSFKNLSLTDFPNNLGTVPYYFVGIDRRVASKYSCLNTPEELKELFKNSSLRYSGVLDAWGLGVNKDCKIEAPGKFCKSSYLYSWQKFPCLEHLVKNGLFKIAKDICYTKTSAKSLANPKASSILEILDITRPILHIAREVDATFSDLSTIQQLWNVDKTIDVEMYKLIKNASLAKSMITIKKEHNIPFAKQLEYINHCSDFQCIPKSEVGRLWSDYLGICKTIGYNLKNKDKRYPDSLKREHDIVQNVNSAIYAFNKDAFKKKAEENSRFNYSLKELDLFARVPTTPQEVVNEGMDLHHCVGHYVNPIINGTSIVAFIRKHSDPDTSYYTVEIVSDGTISKIVQVKGDMNLDFDPNTKEGKILQKFLEKWAKSKKLLLEFEEKD